MGIQDIFSTLSPELFTITAGATVAAAASLYQCALQRLPANLSSQLKGIAETATAAVEQKYKAQTSTISAPATTNTAKKQEAMTIIEDICAELHLPFNEQQANAAIEAAVYTMNLFKK